MLLGVAGRASDRPRGKRNESSVINSALLHEGAVAGSIPGTALP
jgi:hypothetical protein